MTHALDDAFYDAAAGDEVKVIILAGEGRHFSAGHDIGTPGRDIGRSFPRRAGLWWDHVGKGARRARHARRRTRGLQPRPAERRRLVSERAGLS